jgi:hypothetical protein
MKQLKNIAAAVASLVIFSSITNAQTAIPTSYSATTANAEPLAVKYLGSSEEYLVFEVTLVSANSSALFEIEDQNEGALYSTGLDKNATTKTIKIEKKDDQVLNFKLSVDKKVYTKSFSVNTSVVEKTTVAENDYTKL